MIVQQTWWYMCNIGFSICLKFNWSFELLINQKRRDLSVVITSRLPRSMLASRRFLAFTHKLAQLLPRQSNLLASFNFVLTPYVNNNNAKGPGLLPKVWKSYYIMSIQYYIRIMGVNYVQYIARISFVIE